MPTKVLTTEEMQELTVDALLGRKSKITTPDARRFRADTEAYAKKVKVRGGVLDIPFEHPDLSGGE